MGSDPISALPYTTQDVGTYLEQRLPRYPAGVLAAHGMGLPVVPALWSLPHQTWRQRSRPRNPAGPPRFNRTLCLNRNPMYLGHLIYLLGLSLALCSWLGAVITIGVALWFRRRVIGDEKNLATRLGKPYLEYMKKVPRWI